MDHKKIFTVLCACLLLAASAAAAVADLPVKKINGKYYHYYEVQGKETVYSVLHKLQINKDELLKWNPTVADGLRAGQVLYFPLQEDNTSGITPEAAPAVTPEAAPAAAAQSSQSSQGEVVKHYVERGQTIYGIAKKYDMTTDEVIRQNPFLSEGLKAGQTLTLTVGAPAVTPEKAAEPAAAPVKETLPPPQYEGYVVKKKETLYSIAHEHGVTVAQLEEANPGLITLKEGQIINIPLGTSGTPEVTEETSHTTTTPVAVAEVGPDLQPITREEAPAPAAVQPDTLSVAVILPFMLNEETPSKSAQRYTEYYKGLLLAVDSLRSSGTPIAIYAFDTEGSTARLKSILADPQLARARAIVAPDNAEHLELIAEYGKEHGKEVFNHFLVRDESYLSTPGLYQANIPSPRMLDKAINLFAERLVYSTPVFVSLSDTPGDHADFAAALKKRLEEKGIEYKEIKASSGKLSTAELSALASDGNYTFIPLSGKQQDTNKLLAGLNEWREETVMPSIRVVGYPEWVTFRGETLTNMHRLNTSIYTRFYADEGSWRMRNLEAKFLKWYGGAGIENVVPRQGLLGFDSGMFILKHLQNPNAGYDGVQNGYFYQPVTDGGYANDLLYIVDFRPGGIIERSRI